MLAVYKRDLKSYFDSMIGCVYIAFILGFIGIYFSFYNLRSGYPYFGDVLNSVSYMVILALPILTMRCFSEERKSKTDQILYTSRVSIGKIVIGKYLSMVTIFAIPMAVFCTYPIIISKLGSANFKGDYSSILAVFLIGCAYIALGMFMSSLTESPIIAAVITFAILLILQLMTGITNFMPATALGSLIGCLILMIAASIIYYAIAKNAFMAGTIGIAGFVILIVIYVLKSSLYKNLLPAFLNKVPLTESLDNFSLQTFDVTAIIYYVSVGVLFIFLTTQSIQKKRYS